MKKTCPKCHSIDVEKIEDMAHINLGNKDIQYNVDTEYKCTNAKCGWRGKIK
ncbi:hypothetical protein KAJ89_03395 [Candidatus Parcubacteria bacterium]|nr:hypothetical protein [Candidatus Parcubacteria bacterium]